jgi:hypothetical protein
MIVYRCDLCGEIRDCNQREIDRLEYDICSECWSALMAKLKDKGRRKSKDERGFKFPEVLLPELPKETRPKLPGQPPEIIGDSQLAN